MGGLFGGGGSAPAAEPAPAAKKTTVDTLAYFQDLNKKRPARRPKPKVEDETLLESGLAKDETGYG